MTAELHLGKARGLHRMATPAGHFNMVAVDQRHQIAQLLAKRRGIAAEEVSFADMVAVKRVLVEQLGQHASAVLLDPNFCFPAALHQLPGRTGLLVTLEDNRWEETPGGRRSQAIRDWSVGKIKRCGADGVKLLTWFRPDAAEDVIAHQRSFVELIGIECRRHDIALVLELLVYPLAGSDGHGALEHEAPERYAELVLASVREFTHPRYGVDLLKLESPQPGATLPAPDGSADHVRAQQWFDEMGSICHAAGLPWVMLSAGVSFAQFERVMEYAYAAGANGFLAGRAIWSEALESFPDLTAVASGLRVQGQGQLHRLAELTLRAGTSWHEHNPALATFTAEGEVCAAYR
jgi:tagatose 1,6-diphosphate aldolase